MRLGADPKSRQRAAVSATSGVGVEGPWFRNKLMRLQGRSQVGHKLFPKLGQ